MASCYERQKTLEQLCIKCRKFKTCTSVCEKVNKLLCEGMHAIGSMHKIFYFDPQLFEHVSNDDGLKELFVDGIGEYKFLVNRQILSKDTEAYAKKRVTLEYLLHLCIKRLHPPVRFWCLVYCYGLFGFSSISQTEIARRFSLSQFYVSYHIKKAKEIIREGLKRHI